jgi:hypothetical protein
MDALGDEVIHVVAHNAATDDLAGDLARHVGRAGEDRLHILLLPSVVVRLATIIVVIAVGG